MNITANSVLVEYLTKQECIEMLSVYHMESHDLRLLKDEILELVESHNICNSCFKIMFEKLIHNKLDLRYED